MALLPLKVVSAAQLEAGDQNSTPPGLYKYLPRPTNAPVSRAARGAFVSQGAARRRLEWFVGGPLVLAFSGAKGS